MRLPGVFHRGAVQLARASAEVGGSVSATETRGGILSRSPWEESESGGRSQAQGSAADLADRDEVAEERQTRLAEKHQTAEPVFPEASVIKERLRKQMLKPEYDVAMHYHEHGVYQWIARHAWFERLTLCVIAANAIWIGVDTDLNKANLLLEAAPVFQVGEHVFCIFFAFEWTMRFLAFKIKRFALCDTWFAFDSILVCTTVIEAWLIPTIVLAGGATGGQTNASILRLARLLRLSRMARLARLLRAMPELLFLMRGMMAAMRAVTLTLSLLVVIIYVFAVAFTQLCDRTDCGAIFSSVSESMNILFSKATLIDSFSDLTDPLLQQSLWLLLLLYLYVFLGFLTVFNMLTGVIVEVVTGVAASEKEALTVNYVKERIQELVKEGADADGDNMISKKEFMSLLNNRKATAMLHSVGVDVVGLVDFADTIFTSTNESDEEHEKSLSFEEFMEVILDLRGSNKATVRDIVQLRKFVDGRIAGLRHHMLEAAPLNQRTARRKSQFWDDDILGKQNGKALELEAASKLQHLINQSLKEIVDIYQHELSTLRAENCKLRAELTKIPDRTSFRSKSGDTLTHSEGLATASSEMSLIGQWTPLPSEGMPHGPAQEWSDAMRQTEAEKLLEGGMLDVQQRMRRESTLLPGGPHCQALWAGHELECQRGRESQWARNSAAIPPRASRAPWQSRGLAVSKDDPEPIIGKRMSN